MTEAEKDQNAEQFRKLLDIVEEVEVVWNRSVFEDGATQENVELARTGSLYVVVRVGPKEDVIEERLRQALDMRPSIG